jgi:hypothetical protein
LYSEQEADCHHKQHRGSGVGQASLGHSGAVPRARRERHSAYFVTDRPKNY